MCVVVVAVVDSAIYVDGCQTGAWNVFKTDCVLSYLLVVDDIASCYLFF